MRIRTAGNRIFRVFCAVALILSGADLGLYEANAQTRISVKTPVIGMPGLNAPVPISTLNLSPVAGLPSPAVLSAGVPTASHGAALPKPTIAASPVPHKALSAPRQDAADVELAAQAGELFDQSAKVRTGTVEPAARATQKDAIGRLTSRLPAAVLFDWDDTLVNEKVIQDAVTVELFRRLGVALPSLTAARRQWRLDPSGFYEHFFPGMTRKSVDAVWDDIESDLRRGVEINGRRFENPAALPGTLEVLAALKKMGVPLALVSNKREDILLKEVAALGLSGYFKIVYGQRDGRVVKPSSLPITDTLKSMGIAADNVWYVGDQLSDMQAARDRGMLRVLIGRPQRELARERGLERDPAGEIVYIDRTAKLLPILRRLPKK